MLTVLKMDPIEPSRETSLFSNSVAIMLFIIRLNSAIFRIFYISEWNMNIISSDCGASNRTSNFYFLNFSCFFVFFFILSQIVLVFDQSIKTNHRRKLFSSWRSDSIFSYKLWCSKNLWYLPRWRYISFRFRFQWKYYHDWWRIFRNWFQNLNRSSRTGSSLLNCWC